jgi:NAD(P)-dependent dehydrogenase (short-subunit alcohol dehydrogenase family)
MSDRSAVIILGAAGGIGSAVARRIAKTGAPLLLAGRTAEPLQELAADVGGTPFTLDATRPDHVDEAVDWAEANIGPVGGIVNAVGSIVLKPAHATSPEVWDDVIATNLTSAFAAVRAGSRVMRARGGSIVLFSSVAAGLGLANHEAIAAAKAGVEGLARAASATYARHGVRINVVSPGLVRTPLSAGLLRSEDAEAASAGMHPLGRVGEPDDIASAVAWLLDPEVTWVTGEVIAVDGGFRNARSR